MIFCVIQKLFSHSFFKLLLSDLIPFFAVGVMGGFAPHQGGVWILVFAWCSGIINTTCIGSIPRQFSGLYIACGLRRFFELSLIYAAILVAVGKGLFRYCRDCGRYSSIDAGGYPCTVCLDGHTQSNCLPFIACPPTGPGPAIP